MPVHSSSPTPLPVGVTLVLGGARSGKSRHAERLVRATGSGVLYVATCLTRWVDAEMRERIERHRSDRPSGWRTEEDDLDVLGVVGRVEEPVILVDCMTLWLSGRMAEGADEALLLSEARALSDAAVRFGKVVVLVSNELGCGPVPEHPETRKFRDTAGRLNQTLAANATRVDWVVAGIPMTIKPKLEIAFL